MLGRLRSAVVGAVEGFEIGKSAGTQSSTSSSLRGQQQTGLPHKHRYARPAFLHLDEEKMAIAGERKIRPIINASEELLGGAGYAECVNAGKSLYNEDQAVIGPGVIRGSQPFTFRIPYHYFAVFDGHAGFGAALDASKQLHHIVNQKFLDMADDIFQAYISESGSIQLNRDTLITGALESAFIDMDNVIAENRGRYHAAGGCTALVAIIMLGKVYVANAGDSRAVLCTNGTALALSNDFTPMSERHRIRLKGHDNPALLGNVFSCREYTKLPRSEDMGKAILFREPNMTGWAYRTIDETDLRTPIITGRGKRSRVMSTIGVTRGLGDHDLVSFPKRVAIKPFLSCMPEVTVYDIKQGIDNQALILATDGLWDVVSTEVAAKILSNSFENYESKNRWTAAATSLVSCARGHIANPNEGASWRMKDERPASCDDITALIVPLAQYKAVEKELLLEYVQAAKAEQQRKAKKKKLHKKRKKNDSNASANDDEPMEASSTSDVVEDTDCVSTPAALSNDSDTRNSASSQKKPQLSPVIGNRHQRTSASPPPSSRDLLQFLGRSGASSAGGDSAAVARRTSLETAHSQKRYEERRRGRPAATHQPAAYERVRRRLNLEPDEGGDGDNRNTAPTGTSSATTSAMLGDDVAMDVDPLGGGGGVPAAAAASAGVSIMDDYDDDDYLMRHRGGRDQRFGVLRLDLSPASDE